MTPSDVVALAQRLRAAGFRDAIGRPRRGERPLIPELVRRTKLSERHLRRLLKKKGAVSPKDTPAHRDLRLRLQRALGTKVDLVDKGGKGTIVIDWHGYDGLEAILTRLGV